MKSPEVMPTREEILEKAKKIFAEEQVKMGLPPIVPEEEELKEGNYFKRARDQLMRDMARAEEREYLDRMASELGLRVVAERLAEKAEVVPILEERLREERGRRRELQKALEAKGREVEQLERRREVVIPAVTVAPPPIERPVPKKEQVVQRECFDIFSDLWNNIRKGAAIEVAIPTVSARTGIGASLIRKSLSYGLTKNMMKVEKLANDLLSCECLKEGSPWHGKKE